MNDLHKILKYNLMLILVQKSFVIVLSFANMIMFANLHAGSTYMKSLNMDQIGMLLFHLSNHIIVLIICSNG